MRCDNLIFALHFTLSGSTGGSPKSSSTSLPGRSGAAVAAPSTPTEDSTMRGQFAGVARKRWSSWGVEFGIRDRVVSVSAVAARTHTTKQLRYLIIVQFYDAGAASMLTELALGF